MRAKWMAIGGLIVIVAAVAVLCRPRQPPLVVPAGAPAPRDQGDAARTSGGVAPVESALRQLDPASGEPLAAPQGAARRLLGTVVDPRGAGVAGVEVSVVRLDPASGRPLRFEWATSRVTDAGGAFEVAGVAPGLLRIDRGEVAGFLPPFHPEEVRREVPPERGLFATVVAIEEGDRDVAVVLKLHEGGRVRGVVLDGRRRPIAGVEVRIQCLEPGLQGVVADATCDALGRFEMRAFAGSYRTKVHFADRPDLERLVQPAPRDFALEEGEQLELAPLRFGGDGCSIEGRVVDDEGRPFEGLDVLCFLDEESEQPHDWRSALARAATDADGRYRFDDLPAARVAVQIAPEGALRDKRSGRKLLAWWVEPLEVDLQHDPAIVAPERVAVRYRPWVLKGVVVGRAKEARIDATIELLDPRLPDARPWVLTAPVALRDREFTWECATPHPAVKVTFRGRRGELLLQRRLDPREGEERVEFALPDG